MSLILVIALTMFFIATTIYVFAVDSKISAIENYIETDTEFNKYISLNTEESCVFANAVYETLTEIYGDDFLERFNRNSDFFRNKLTEIKNNIPKDGKKYYTAQEIMNSVSQENQDE